MAIQEADEVLAAMEKEVADVQAKYKDIRKNPRDKKGDKFYKVVQEETKRVQDEEAGFAVRRAIYPGVWRDPRTCSAQRQFSPLVAACRFKPCLFS